MSELINWIRKQAANQLVIQLAGLKNLSSKKVDDDIPPFHVGDKIEFGILLNNNNPFPLSNLKVTVHEVQAAEFQENPVMANIEKLAGGGQKQVALIRGKIRSNPDDARSAWRKLDRICRVTVSGEIDLPPIEFQDEEFEVVQIKDA